jgi:DNA-binding transcriptional LysR family regulator
MSFMNIDLRSLKHVVALSELLSYTQAAQKLCLTQSALSRSIQAVEKFAQVRLFDRDRGGVHLTPVGRSFVERAALLLRDADDLGRMLRRTANAEIGELAFGIGPLPAKALLPEALSAALVTTPDLRTNIMVRNVEALLPALVAEHIEFIVCAEGQIPKSAPVKGAVLGGFPLSLLVRAGHPVLDAAVTQSDRKYPWISSGPIKGTEKWPSYFRPYLTGTLHIVEDYGVVTRIIERTDAIWAGSTFAASEEIREGRLKEIPVPNGQRAVRIRMIMYTLERRSLSPGALRVKSTLQDLIRALDRDPHNG